MPVVIFLKKFLLVMLLTPVFYTFSQPFTYFNYRYDINGNGLKDDCFAIVESEDGYVLAGSSLVIRGNIYWWEEKLTKLDEYGEIQYIRTYGEDTVDYFFSNVQCIIRDYDHFYAVGKRRTPTSNWVHDEGTLMYLDENLDTLWMRRYGEKSEPFDTAYLFTCIQKINQDELIITGSWKPYGLATHVYLIKTDTLGNIIWDNSYSYYNYYIDGYSLAQTSDSGFIIGCFKQTPGYPDSVDPVLIKTDSCGNQEWTKNLGGPYKDYTPVISIAPEGNIIVGTSYADTMYTTDIPLSRIKIFKLDNEGNIIWNKIYGYSQPHNYLRNIRVLSDGSIIAVGSVLKFNPEPDRLGWIIKTSPNGDSIWHREYRFLSGYESRNYLYDIIYTADNGLIACGYVVPNPPDTGSVDTWVIKLDSIGCDTAGCDPTVWIVEEDEKIRGREAERMVIWPNPARDVIHVHMDTWTHMPFPKDVTLTIYDIYGRTITAQTPTILPSCSPTVLPSSQEITIDVSGYPPGLYIITITGDRQETLSGKFVICR
jgi:hypothetical protein